MVFGSKLDPQKNTPAYLKMSSVERVKRSEKFYKMMEKCTLCPRSCRVNRLEGERGKCGAADSIYISSAGPHFGEERELVGPGGSGTIFFMNCNLKCVFCQNWTISHDAERGEEISVDELAAVMLSLQKQDCSNINLVSPTPYLYQITSAIDLAADQGLRLPVVYNCGGYEAVESLRLLDDFVDIYMPDAKFASDSIAKRYTAVDDYFTRLREGLKEMQNQVGDLKTGLGGLAYRGLLIRHLVMPENLAESEKMARFLSKEISAVCAVNVMAQYYPAHEADKHPPLNRRINSKEYITAREAFHSYGHRLL